MILQRETKKSMVRFRVGMTAAALAAAMAMPVWAASDDTIETLPETEEIVETVTEAETEDDGPVQVDPVTGEEIVTPTASDDTSSSEITSDVKISTNCVYSAESGFYEFTDTDFDGTVLTSDVADYAIVNGEVCVRPNSSLNCELYKDGILVTDPDMEHISDPGDYGVLISGQGIPLVNMLHFTIIGEYTNAEGLDMQGIYEIQSATFNDEAISVQSDHIDFDEDGEYKVVILNKSMGFSYTVTTNVLRTAPTLKLEAVDENNVARGPVDISDIDPEWTATVYYEGKVMDISQTTKLTDSGYYTIILDDKAGNETTYNFTITLYLDLMAMIFVIIIFVLALGAFIYLVIDRKKKKVR